MQPKANTLSSQSGPLIALGLAVLTFLVFIPTLSHGTVDFDDPTYVERPIVAKGMTMGGLRWALTATADSNWFPLTWLSHMLDAQLYGQNWGGHHATSILLHALNVSLVFLVLRAMTGARWKSAIVAALFAIHPLRVESVSWLAERKDVLCGTFFLLTLLLYARYAKKRSWSRYLLVVLSFACALMSKPMAVTLPLLLILLDFWPLHRVGSAEADRTSTKESFVGLFLEKLPLFALSAISCVITMRVQRRGGAMNLGSFTLSQRLANAAVSIVRYLWKTIWPIDLSVYYPHPGSWPIGFVIASVGLIMIVIALAIFLRRRMPYLLVGWFGFLLLLVPVLGIVQVGLQSMADRYTYLPSIFLLVAVVWLLADLKARLKLPESFAIIPAVIVLLFLSFSTWYQQSYWRDAYALFSHAVAIDPDNSFAEYILGTSLAGTGNDADALAHFERAIELDPGDPIFYYAYGGSLNRIGRADDAVAAYTKSLELRPDFSRAHFLLAVTLSGKGDFTTAEPHFARAAELAPNEATIEMAWAQALQAQNRPAEANAHFARAYDLQLKADQPK
ncbi:MAG TPA: tetratricopeptide repeat protein [Tepidisphaeraceae bacterium]|nr:tetratricopeptide repeat protein [Tepidisphaeraceae bacterium]